MIKNMLMGVYFLPHGSCLVMGLVMAPSLLLACGRKLKHQLNLRLSAYLVIKNGEVLSEVVLSSALLGSRNLAGDALTVLLIERRKR